MIAKRVYLVILGLGMLCLACSRSNNLFLGRVEATVGGHLVEVTDCYRTSVPPPQQLQDLTDGKHVYHFTPCRDADVLIRGDELSVNGTSYGALKLGDVVTVDHGRVLVNEHEAKAAFR
jgi:hypothetical protein